MPEVARPDPSSDLHAGVLVADKYQLLRCVGRGGMGEVWRARHTSLGHDVAVKFLATGQLSRSALLRFEREAKVSARLGEMSRHIVRVHDHGALGERPFVVMELLSGESLAECLAREHTLPPTAIVRVVDHLCKALAIAHGEGVVHRDLKPANAFLSRLPEDHDFLVKLLDFGVAKGCIGDEDSAPSGSLVGTLSYMSPEQLLGEPQIDGRADLWAVGVLAYRMAVGRGPFSFGDRGDLVARILGATPTRVSQLSLRFPAAFDNWMAKALAKKPDERFADARELSRCLAESLGLDPAESRPSMLKPSSRPASARAEPARLEQVESEAQGGHTENVSARTTAPGGAQAISPPFSPASPSAAAEPAAAESPAPEAKRPRKLGQRLVLAALAVMLLSLASPHFGKSEVLTEATVTVSASRPATGVPPGEVISPATPAVAPVHDRSSDEISEEKPPEPMSSKDTPPSTQRARASKEPGGASPASRRGPMAGVQTRSKQLWDSDESY